MHTLRYKTFNKPIILIGFTHVGKTSIGRELARCLNQSFTDLDKILENQYYLKTHARMSCRQIMQLIGEVPFRTFESETLKLILPSTQGVIALGGGTPLSQDNQKLIESEIVIHIKAPKTAVFERMLQRGVPAFFDPVNDPLETFNRLWNERIAIYESLTRYSIENSSTIDNAVKRAIIILRERIQQNETSHA